MARPPKRPGTERQVARVTRRATGLERRNIGSDSTENIGDRYGVRSIKPDGSFEPDSYALRATGDGGSIWQPEPDLTAGFVDPTLSDTDLVAYWRMGEAAGNQLDYSNNLLGPEPLIPSSGATPGTYDVAGGLIPAEDDGAYDFTFNQADHFADSTGTIFSASDTRWRFAGLLPFTIECLFKPTAGWLATSNIFHLAGPWAANDPDGSPAGWGLYVIFNRQIGFDRGLKLDLQVSPIDEGEWCHIVGTYDGATKRLYINGVLRASVADVVVLPGTNDTFNVGGSWHGGAAAGTYVKRTVYGPVDEVAVYDVSKGDAWVAARYESILNPAGLVGGAGLADGAVTTPKIADGAVTAPKLATGAVTSAKILDGTIVNADVAAAAAIAVSKLAPGTNGSWLTTVAGVPVWTAPSIIPAVRAYHSAAQSLLDQTFTTLALNSERFDTDVMHDLVTNNSRLTCKTAGKYLIVANVRFASNVNGARLIRIMLNGATVIGGAAVPAVATVGVTTTLTAATIYELAVNDYVELQGYQASGGALNVESGTATTPEFQMVKVG